MKKKMAAVLALRSSEAMAADCPGMLELLAFLFLLMAGGVSSTVADPIALHQLVSVPAGQDAVIRLKSYDTSGSQVCSTAN